MPRIAVPTHAFVLVVCHHEGALLLVEERKHGGGYYLPAGGVEPGETYVQAAVRETLEEAAVQVEPEALLAIDHSYFHDGSGLSQRLRFILRARVVGDPTPKRVPDEHTLGARWVAPHDLPGLRLRHSEVLDWAVYESAPSQALELEHYRARKWARAS